MFSQLKVYYPCGIIHWISLEITDTLENGMQDSHINPKTEKLRSTRSDARDIFLFLSTSYYINRKISFAKPQFSPRPNKIITINLNYLHQTQRIWRKPDPKPAHTLGRAWIKIKHSTRCMVLSLIFNSIISTDPDQKKIWCVTSTAFSYPTLQ